MKNWQSFSALKRVKNETENLTAALANALENVIVTPAGEAKSLEGLAEPIQSFTIIPGILLLLEYPNIAVLADEILDLLEDTRHRPDLDPDKLDARLQIAYVSVMDVPALLEDALNQSGDSFAKVFHVINQVRKTWDRAAIFDSRTLSAKQKVSFRKQFAASPDKMKDMLARQAALYVKAGKVLLEEPGNEKAINAVKGVVANMELMFRDYRIGTLWGLAAGVMETAPGGAGLDENSVKAVIALAKPLHMLSTGDLSQLDTVEDKVLGKMLDVISASKAKSMRLAIIRQWYGLDRAATKQMKGAFRKIQVRFARKSALNKSLHLINEDISALIDNINMLIESGQLAREKVGEIYQGVFNLREVLVFLRMSFLAGHIEKSLKPEPGEDLETALSEAAGVLFVISKELVDKLDNMEREVFSNEAGLSESSSLSSARLHVYLTAMNLLETVITDIDAYVDNGCQGGDLRQARDILDELSCVFTVVTLPEQKQYLVTARDYLAQVAHGVEETMPDASFHALSHLVINSLGYLEQLSIGREKDSRAFLEKSGRFAGILQAFVDAHPTPPDDEHRPDPVEIPEPDEQEEVPDERPPEEPVPVEVPEPPVPVEVPEIVPQFPGEAPIPVEEPETLQESALQEQATAEDSNDDDDIKCIFAEEFDEVLENLREETASLPGDFQQPGAIKDCCRYFHTLKGSGRMVGAEDIGTLSFAMEKLYDYLGEHQGMDERVLELTGRVLDTLPAMKDNFMDAGSPAPDAAHILQLCHEALGFMSPEAAAEVSIPDKLATAAADAIPIVTDSVPTLSESVDISGEEILEETVAATAAPDEGEMDLALVSRELEEINNRISGILAGGEESPTTSDLLVPLHTLYGIARVQNLENYANAVSAMEKFQESHPRKTITGDMAVVFQGFCLLTNKLARHFKRGGNSEYAELAFDAIDLEKALEDLTENMQQTAPAGTATDTAQAQDPVLAGFLREARDLVARLEQQAGTGAGNPEPAAIASLQQSLNLLAGAAEVAEINAVEKVAASMEAAYGQLGQTDTETDATLRAALAEGHAWLAAMPAQLDAGQEPEGSDALCDKLLVALETPAEPAMSVTPEVPPVIPESVPEAAANAPAEPEEAVDQELLDIYLDEANEILEALDSLYLRWQEGDEGVIDEYLRHLHTLKGSSALVLERELSKAAHEYETFIIDARNKKQGFDGEFFATCDGLLQGLQNIFRLYSRDDSGMIVRQSAPGAAPAAPAPVAETAAAAPLPEPDPETEPEPEPKTEPEPEPAPAVTAQAAPAAAEEDPVDQTLMEIFLDEANEILEELDSLYLRWQEGDESVIDEYLRNLHTLKGSSALVREMDLSKGAHEFETLIIDARNAKQGYDAEFFTACDKRMQALQEIYRLYSRDAKGLIVRAGAPATTTAQDSTPATATPIPASPPVQAAQVQARPVEAAPRVEAGTQPPPKAVQNIQAAVDEQVRVSSQLLKNLMNDADEINFSRNRIEKSFTDISTLLVDMDETLSRLRSYVKRFEDKARESYNNHIEENTEQETGRISDEFDSLEMDRYTELHEMSLSLTEDYDDLQDIRMNLAGRLKDVDNVLLGQQRLTNSLQDGLISSQMVPFSSIVPRLRRLVRQISRDLKKDVRFEVENQQGNLDKNVLQAIITPFEHIIRNALDHGIETPEQRRAAGKPEQAVLSVKVSRMGASILIEIRDDGRGINVEKVKSRAIERGILDKDADISHEAACMLLFKAGFSTADAVSSISGRGVGLDVVKSEITQIGGTVQIASEYGKGTAFIIQLPLTTSLNRSLMFEVQGQRFVVLMNSLDGVKIEKLSNILRKQQDNEIAEFEYGGKTYEYVYLGKLLDMDVQPKLESVDASIPMLLVSGKQKNYALHIDAIIENRDLVVKSLSKQFAAMPGIGGGVIMPDGNVAIVLDLVSLVSQSGDSEQVDALALLNATRKEGETRPRLIMVVDDSITVRKVTSATLKRHGLEVITAKNGLEALELLETQLPDVILLDIEMPKMDGFEVATHIRKQPPPIGAIPIIMITSRIGDKHRTRAQEIGVNEFMSKPFVEDVLIEHIRSYRKQ